MGVQSLRTGDTKLSVLSAFPALVGLQALKVIHSLLMESKCSSL